MAREHGGPDGDAVNAACPLRCGRRRGAAGDTRDQASARDQVDWAGLPVNLDLVFSRQQRDKVYVQHLMRKRGTPLRSWLQDGAPLCACDVAANYGRAYPVAAESMSGR
ncbi:hypothetical protein [Mycobacterium malmoense]|uniref:Uncharacterized protein n=1 Tax=Mycobacterium malmoense TaxID=1780 RepID=A0ABX3ST88_MYCMA|nr:hypothetical protein [Mycobacterium malmoense]ORA83263.1 hypothetical protein BST29_10370 [Mycobacterium malmoense]